MSEINYDEISKKYDNVREAEVTLINLFLGEIKINENTRILDFGCGTGNYASKVKKLTNADMFGIDPSNGMIEKAKKKNNGIMLKEGNHENIPFPKDHFDFIYMTDVIHHVPDIGIMFKEMRRVLKEKGKICVVTESYEQIVNRCIVDYFPTTAEVDKKRYPSIAEIIKVAKENGFEHIKNLEVGKNEKVKIDKNFFELVRNKGYSMLHLISDTEYEKGLEKVKSDFKKGGVEKINSGGTLIWLKKVHLT